MRALRWLTLILLLAPNSATAQEADPGHRMLLSAHARIREAGLQGDRALRSARARLAASEFAVQAAGGAPAASLDVQITDGPRFDIPAGNATAILSRGLGLGARQRAARAVAETARRAAFEEVQVREREINALALHHLARAASSRQRVDRLRAASGWLGEAEQSLTARFAAGEASYMDVLRLRSERLRLQADEAATATELADAVVDLTLLVGDAMTDAGLRALVDSAATASIAAWSALLPPLPAGWESLEIISPRLRDALTAAERSDAELQLLRASQRPAYHGGIGLQRIGPVNGGPAVGLVLGFSSSLPFTARAGNARREAASSAAVRSAEANVEAVRAETRANVRATATQYTAALERLRGFDEALMLAAGHERETALSQYQSGRITLMELLDFEQALLRVDTERFRTVVTAAEARGTLLGLVPSLGSAP